MNKSQRIYLSTGTTETDKYFQFQLEQDVDTLEFMTMSIYTKDAYQDFNADYGVLVGRVIANGGIGIPNAKISIFIPLTDTDAEDGEIASIYPYKTPRDKNAQGKRYNLLPRVSEYEQDSGLYKPKQPFGSFPIKPEIVTNQSFLDVYKKYYKYTALSNQYGDYMIFGVPIGLQTVHLSVDITDIGKYSMTPASMIKAGYPANLFIDNGKAIKSSEDLGDLPNIETQEIAVDIMPFWGDTVNFTIGITRQDFRIRAILESSFVIFGTSMTMGNWSTIGDPDRDEHGFSTTNFGFYMISNEIGNNLDIRTYRPAELVIDVFTYNTNIPIASIIAGTVDPTDASTIIQLSKSQYFENNTNGNFLLEIPCNRRKIITSESGQDTIVEDNSPFGVFTEFYGMITIGYADLSIDKSYKDKFRGGPSEAHPTRGRLKIPQRFKLMHESIANVPMNNQWRKEYQKFLGGEIYSVAQFLPTRETSSNYSHLADAYDITEQVNSTNVFKDDGGYSDVNWMGGSFFKVAGTNSLSAYQTKYDNNNYLIDPISGSTPEFRYDFPANQVYPPNVETAEFFGAQWLNLCLVFPQFVWAFRHGTYRTFSVADVFWGEYYSTTYFALQNNQPIFAGLVNTQNFLRGDAYQTAFINIPRSELAKLNQTVGITSSGLNVLKGINISKWNNDAYNVNLGLPKISTTPFKYRNPKPSPSIVVDKEDYSSYGWDSYYPYSGIQVGNKPTAYLFKGMYENDCIKMLFDFNII